MPDQKLERMPGDLLEHVHIVGELAFLDKASKHHQQQQPEQQESQDEKREIPAEKRLDGR
jgi:hypothetical protein